MITLNMKDKEVDLELVYESYLGTKPKVTITGSADLSHHLIEGLFNIIDKLAKMENCCHRKEEYET